MSKSRWEQIAAAGGILFVVMQLAGQMLIQIGGAEPAFAAPVDEIVSFFNNRNAQTAAAGGVLSFLSLIALLWFLGALYAQLRRHEEEPAWMSLAAFGAGLVGVAVILSSAGWELALFRLEDGLDPQIARLLFDQGNYSFANFWVALAAFLFTAGISIIRDGALPRWLGWFGLVVALLLLVARVFWTVPSNAMFLPYALFWVWLIAASIGLIRRIGRV